MKAAAVELYNLGRRDWTHGQRSPGLHRQAKKACKKGKHKKKKRGSFIGSKFWGAACPSIGTETNTQEGKNLGGRSPSISINT